MTYRLHDSWANNKWYLEPDNFSIINEWFSKRPEGFELWVVHNSIREQFVKPVLPDKCKNKTVIDLGCGSGYHGVQALLHGADFVYFIDIDSQTTAIIEKGLSSMCELGIIKDNSYCVINSDIELLTHDHFNGPTPQVVISEFWGPLVFDEGFQIYSEHLDSLFDDLYHMPECLSVQICSWPADFSASPWPHTQPYLTEIYKAYYANKPFINKLNFLGEDTGLVNLKEQDAHCTVHGEIFYHANRRELVDRCTINIKESSQMIGVLPSYLGCVDGKYFSKVPRYGWWVDEPGTYELHIDVTHNKKAPTLIKVVDEQGE